MNPRPGAPRTITDTDVERILALTLESTPRDATHWSTRSMAQRAGMTQSAVSRIWRAFALQPHRTETFKLSNDPLFIEKVRDVVGLYLDPPDRALVLSVDEKSEIQALDRTRGAAKLYPSSGKVGGELRVTLLERLLCFMSHRSSAASGGRSGRGRPSSLRTSPCGSSSPSTSGAAHGPGSALGIGASGR
jgi:transcriptional regulator with XRE-family HTH domain